MPRRSADPEPDPKAFTQSSIAIASLVTMVVSAFAAVFTTIALIKGVIAAHGMTPDVQTQLVGSLVPIVTLVASAVAFFSRILKKDQPPIVAVTKAGVRRQIAARDAEAINRRARRIPKPPPAP